MSVYYNECDPFAAAWLRELMRDGLIAPGWVDERSIEDVKPQEVEGFTQCHFFAGIGVWSLALRVAGWPDERPIWTGSCPCQPFSAAGKGVGFADERHLWPAWYHLIEHGKRRDVVVVGEQVASKDGRAWYDLVSGDMQALDHACGAVDTSAASLGAPFIGQRLYWLASTSGARLEGHGRSGQFDAAAGRQVALGHGTSLGALGRLGQTDSQRRTRIDALLRAEAEGRFGTSEVSQVAGSGAGGGLAPSDSGEREQQSSERRPGGVRGTAHGSTEQQQRFGDHSAGLHRLAPPSSDDHGSPPRQTRHSAGIPLHPVEYWRDADWLLCRDPNGARFRPVEPGAFPLVDAGAVRNRLAAVRGAGNALNISQAACFIEAVMEVLDQ